MGFLSAGTKAYHPKRYKYGSAFCFFVRVPPFRSLRGGGDVEPHNFVSQPARQPTPHITCKSRWALPNPGANGIATICVPMNTGPRSRWVLEDGCLRSQRKTSVWPQDRLRGASSSTFTHLQQRAPRCLYSSGPCSLNVSIPTASPRISVCAGFRGMASVGSGHTAIRVVVHESQQKFQLVCLHSAALAIAFALRLIGLMALLASLPPFCSVLSHYSHS